MLAAMQMLLILIMSWLTINFGLPAAGEPPRVAFASQKEMAQVRHDRLARSGPGRALIAAGQTQPPDSYGNVHAVYDAPNRTIYLPEGWSADSPADVSLLVHEMAHHLQHSGQTIFACPAERERQAYEAQARWLELYGTSLSDEFGIDAATVLALSVCTH